MGTSRSSAPGRGHEPRPRPQRRADWSTIDADAATLALRHLGRGPGVTTSGHRFLVVATKEGLSAFATREGTRIATAAAPPTVKLLAGAHAGSWLAVGSAEEVSVLDAPSLREIGRIRIAAERAECAEDGTRVIVGRTGEVVVVVDEGRGVLGGRLPEALVGGDGGERG